MSRTENTRPIQIQLDDSTYWRHRYPQHVGGCWPNRGKYATARNRAERMNVNMTLRLLQDWDELVLPDRHRHATKWDIW